MPDRSWLGLAIRVVGLLVASTTLASVVSVWTSVWSNWHFTNGTGITILELTYALSSTIQFAVGLLLMAKGDVLAKRWLRDLNSRCPTCLYDIRGLTSAVCPECGAPIKRSSTDSSNASSQSGSSAV